MGFRYANITLKTTDQQGVAQYLNSIQRNSFVLPPIKGYVIVCDEKSDTYEPNEIAILANQLSKRFTCIAIASINFDDDILWYRLYEHGEKLDEYNSNPDYFETGEHRGPIGGNAKTLCKIFNKPESISKVEKILLAKHGESYILEIDRHSKLANILGWFSPYLSLSYEEIVKGDLGTNDITVFARPLTRRLLRQFIETDSNLTKFDLDKELVKLLHKKRKSAKSFFVKNIKCVL